jgi:hypothetical protein
MELLNKSQLAERLGRSQSYVSAMCRKGFKTACGRTTLKSAYDWLLANPDFRVSDVYERAVTPRKKSAKGTRRSVLV